MSQVGDYLFERIQSLVLKYRNIGHMWKPLSVISNVAVAEYTNQPLLELVLELVLFEENVELSGCKGFFRFRRISNLILYNRMSLLLQWWLVALNKNKLFFSRPTCNYVVIARQRAMYSYLFELRRLQRWFHFWLRISVDRDYMTLKWFNYSRQVAVAK